MSNTPNLNLPLLSPAQADKHVTVNDALLALDREIGLVVADCTLQQPPQQPQAGSTYIPAPGATGLWAGKTGWLMQQHNGAWQGWPARTGMTAYCRQSEAFMLFDGSAWIDCPVAPPTRIDHLGIGTDPTQGNALTVAGQGCLLDGGNGDMRLYLNAGSGQSVASVVFQHGYSGRLELGFNTSQLAGVRVSSDGSNWRDALVIDPHTAAVTLPATPPRPALINLLGDAGRFAGTPEPPTHTAGGFTAPSYIYPLNGSQLLQGPQFHHNSQTFGGSATALAPVVEELISAAKDTAYRRYGVEFHLLKVVVGSGTSFARNAAGTLHYVAIASPSGPFPYCATLAWNLRVESGSVALPSGTEASSLGSLSLNGQKKTGTSVLQSGDGWTRCVRHFNRDPAQSLGYNDLAWEVAATPGTVFYLACPSLVSGIDPAGLPSSPMGGPRAWG